MEGARSCSIATVLAGLYAGVDVEHSTRRTRHGGVGGPVDRGAGSARARRLGADGPGLDTHGPAPGPAYAVGCLARQPGRDRIGPTGAPARPGIPSAATFSAAIVALAPVGPLPARR